MDRKQEKIQRNYREAEARRKQKERIAQARQAADAARLPETQAKLQQAQDKLTRGVQLPPQFLEALVENALAILAVELARTLRIRHPDIDAAVKEAMAHVLIRTPHASAGELIAREDWMRDEPGTHFSFRLPEIHWTEFLDKHEMEQMFGRAGPVYMRDQAVVLMQQAPSTYRGSGEVKLSDDVEVI